MPPVILAAAGAGVASYVGGLAVFGSAAGFFGALAGGATVLLGHASLGVAVRPRKPE